ncbi:MAG: 16S rRNA (guanine(527)-N(7))-methyltransferase RsmG [Clostridia bacterium]|nr:16S rRNA (guanine(527)-N(7))-methyltransferase RsmG [Clostridia bacterium]
MDFVFDRNLFTQNLDALGIAYTPEQLAQLNQYAALLVEWNQKMNLTAITSPEGIAVLHFADSLTLLKSLPLTPGQRVLDVGTGAGFPAIPLKIACPAIDLTMMDSLNKRLTFLQTVLNELHLSATLRHARAEEAAHLTDLREQFDVVTARAVASMQVLAEYCLPYVKVGGYFVAMKGPSCPEELQVAQNAIALLGGKVERVDEYTLSDGSKRHIAIIQKVKTTNQKYPRHGSKIAKKPL